MLSQGYSRPERVVFSALYLAHILLMYFMSMGIRTTDVCAPSIAIPTEARRGIEVPGIRVTDVLGAENQTWLPCKSSLLLATELSLQPLPSKFVSYSSNCIFY